MPLALPPPEPVVSPKAVTQTVNRARRRRGLRPVRFSPALARTARRMSRHLASTGVLAHEASIHTPPAFRSFRGEVLADFSRRVAPRTLVSAWMHSPPHRAILLSRTASAAGFGVATGHGLVFYTGQFGKR